LERVSAVQVVSRLEAQCRIPPVASVFVSNNGAAARHADYVCDSAFAEFISGELLPCLFAQHPAVSSDNAVLIGLSLSGLAAAHAALTSGRFRAAVCQSPSFWWERERFASTLPAARTGAAAFWVSVGDLERESGVTHPPSGLFQGTSQLESCERGSAALEAAGYRVSYRVFQGGHDPVCWRDDLALALPWATSA
jgi:enterochelin esterase family protein